METNNNNISNTMEINAILEEAKRHREGVAEKTPQPNQTSSQPQQQDMVDIQNDFVIYDEDKPKKQKKQKKQKDPKAKKRAVMAAVISGVAVLVLAAGFCVYTVFAEFKFPSDVYVNDISVEGLSINEAEKLLETTQRDMLNKLNVNAVAAEKSIALTQDDAEYKFNTSDVLKGARDYCKENRFSNTEQRFFISVTLTDDEYKELADKVAKALDQEAKDAQVTKFDSSKKGDKRFTMTDSQTGIVVDEEQFITQLKEFFSQGKVEGDIEVSAQITEPEFSSQYLLDNIKKLSSFTTTSTNNANGNANMKLSLSQCNNSIINPGETWSFNDCTGNSNLTSNGYKPAGVIVNGKHTTGVGGGICQSSTTIYNAAMLCGMEVVERSCHYYKSTYVDAGRDATVDYGNLDLKVKNPFKYQLFMECYMDGTVLHCNMYGLQNDEFDKIKIDSSITSYFSNGFRAQTTRTFYLDSKKIKTESLPNSTYYTSEPGGSSSKKSSKKSSSKKSSKVEGSSSSQVTSSEVTSSDVTSSEIPPSSIPSTSEAPGDDSSSQAPQIPSPDSSNADTAP